MNIFLSTNVEYGLGNGDSFDSVGVVSRIEFDGDYVYVFEKESDFSVPQLFKHNVDGTVDSISCNDFDVVKLDSLFKTDVYGLIVK